MIVRKANNTKKDCDLVYALSNDPIVRSCSFNQNIIEYANHISWFKRSVEDKKVLFLLVFVDKTENDFIGQIRFNRESELSESCIISLSITEQYRGKHIASDFIELGINELKRNWPNIKKIIAEVKNENIASNKLFSREKFELISIINTYEKII